jgi:Protein of unknown function (DUF3617)
MSRTYFLAGVVCAFVVYPVSAYSASHGASIAPGEYHTTISITSLTGLPAEMAHGIMSTPHVVDNCIATSDLNELLHDELAADEEMICSENRSTAANGHLSGTATCHDTEGAAGKMGFKGTYTSTHIDVYADMAGNFTMGPITEKVHIVSDRTGACSGTTGG